MKHLMPIIGGSFLLLSHFAQCAEIPENQWTLKETLRTKSKSFCSTIYMPATDEFLLWGLPHDRFEVETFSVKTGKWQNAKPAEGLLEFPKRGFGDRVHIHGQALPTRVTFFEKEGVGRPTRAPVFHQLTYDTKRDRALFFVGGKTFSYDPKTRLWKNLKPAKSPVACGSLVWASLCYDPVNDEALLFGGGMALNLWGGAYTWLYDCKKNTWKELEQPREEQPPLRGCVQSAYDSKNRVILLFGGDAQSKLLADTWIYDTKTRTWTERKPELAPPPLLTCGLTFLADRGLFLLCGGKDQTWTYDVPANRWTRIKGLLSKEKKFSGSTAFMSCSYSTKDKVALLLGGGRLERFNRRRTWLYRLRPETATHPEQTGSKPGTFEYRLKYLPYKAISKAERAANLEKLKNLPANTMVDARPPETVTSKTWSTATIDTHRGEIIYTGGGHSGYCGTDWAHYSVADNRWSMGWAPKAPPYLWAASVQPYGWAYDGEPWSTHTRFTYQYDPQSRMCIYLNGYSELMHGESMLLSEDSKDAFRYDYHKLKQKQWVYNPVEKKLLPPQFGNPLNRFGNGLYGGIGTPHGIYIYLGSGQLRRGTIKDGVCSWKVISKQRIKRQMGGEVHPMVYDSKRDRLLQLCGLGKSVNNRKKVPPYVIVNAYCFKTGKWEELKTTGYSELSRDAVYNSKQDCIMILTSETWFVLDCKTVKWRSIDCAIPKGTYGWDSALVYDPVHDVAVSLVPTRFSGPVQTILFRYDPKTAKYKKTQ